MYLNLETKASLQQQSVIIILFCQKYLLFVNCSFCALTYYKFDDIDTDYKKRDTCLVAASFFCRCSIVSSATRIFLRASSSASFLLSFLSLSSSSRTRILSSSTWVVQERVGRCISFVFLFKYFVVTKEFFFSHAKKKCAKV